MEALSWDFFAMTAANRRAFGAGSKAPVTFPDVQQYVKLFRPLLMEELRAHLLQVLLNIIAAALPFTLMPGNHQ